MGYLQDAKLGLPWEGEPPTVEALWNQLDAALRRANTAEGALREAEKDIAFIHEQHDEEAVRVYTQIFDLNAKLQEAESKTALLQEKWHRAEMQILEDADELDLLRNELARYDALQQPKAGQ